MEFWYSDNTFFFPLSADDLRVIYRFLSQLEGFTKFIFQFLVSFIRVRYLQFHPIYGKIWLLFQEIPFHC